MSQTGGGWGREGGRKKEERSLGSRKNKGGGTAGKGYKADKGSVLSHHFE